MVEKEILNSFYFTDNCDNTWVCFSPIVLQILRALPINSHSNDNEWMAFC